MLSAVDSAVMLVDAAKGLEPQTLKLFQVCAHRGIPVITVINKWDRPGLDALQLMDDIERQIGLKPTPLTWTVGIAGDFQGVLDRRTGRFVHYTRTPGGATRAPERHLDPAEAADLAGEDWSAAQEEHALLAADHADHEQATFLAGTTTPVLFASALLNFGVAHLLDVLLELAPPPGPTATVSGGQRPAGADFSAYVFKVQAGMDAAHRDRPAYALDALDYKVARRTTRDHAPALHGLRGVEVLERSDGAHLALFPDKWRVEAVRPDHPDLVLDPLPASAR